MAGHEDVAAQCDAGFAAIIICKAHDTDVVDVRQSAGGIVVQILMINRKRTRTGRERKGFRCPFAPVHDQLKRVERPRIEEVCRKRGDSVLVD